MYLMDPNNNDILNLSCIYFEIMYFEPIPHNCVTSITSKAAPGTYDTDRIGSAQSHADVLQFLPYVRN